jgi:hypothetical protein
MSVGLSEPVVCEINGGLLGKYPFRDVEAGELG